MLWGAVLDASFVHWQGDYDKAHAKARAMHKPLLVLLVKSDPFSRELIRTVFMDRPYVEAINRRTIPLLLTYGTRASYPIELYYTTTFPTLFLVDATHELFLLPPLYAEAITPVSVAKMLSF